MDIPHIPFDLLHHFPFDSNGALPLWATAWVHTWLHTWSHAVAAMDLGNGHPFSSHGLLDVWGDNFGALLAQSGTPQQFDQNILADLSRAWNNFIRTGQAAALGIGLFIGYMFRFFTSSG